MTFGQFIIFILQSHLGLIHTVGYKHRDVKCYFKFKTDINDAFSILALLTPAVVRLIAALSSTTHKAMFRFQT